MEANCHPMSLKFTWCMSTILSIELVKNLKETKLQTEGEKESRSEEEQDANQDF